MGNGAKVGGVAHRLQNRTTDLFQAQQKRERNAKDAAGGGGKSQLKSVCRHCVLNQTTGLADHVSCEQNEASKTIVCKACKQNFQVTMKRPALEEHAQNKHSKTYEDCFE